MQKTSYRVSRRTGGAVIREGGKAPFTPTAMDKQPLTAAGISAAAMAPRNKAVQVSGHSHPFRSTRMTVALTKSPRNWDPVVKLTHWSIVAAVLCNGVFTEGGSWPHIWVGYALAGMLVLRLLWGLVGPREARFSAFPPSLPRALAHIREIRAGKVHDQPSHNPLGALMVYAIWGTLGIIIASGIAMAGLPPRAVTHDHHGVEQAAQSVDEEGEDGEGEESPLGEMHEAAVNLLYLLIVLHLGGVVFETRRSGRGLVLAMLPGRR
jgi:cytochrome b